MKKITWDNVFACSVFALWLWPVPLVIIELLLYFFTGTTMLDWSGGDRGLFCVLWLIGFFAVMLIFAGIFG